MLMAACLEKRRGLMLRQAKRKVEQGNQEIYSAAAASADGPVDSYKNPTPTFFFCNVGSSLIAVIFVLSAIAVLASDVSRSAEKP